MCSIDHQGLLDLSEMVYLKKNADEEELNNKFDVYSVDKDLKIVHIRRDFRILQRGDIEQVRFFCYVSC